MKDSLQKRKQDEVWQQQSIIYHQEREIRRLSWKNLSWELAEALNLNRGLAYTMIGLTIRPAATIREYLNEGRYKVMSPARYFLLVVGIVVFVAVQKGFFDKAPESFKIEVNGETDAEKMEVLQKAEERMGQAYQEYFVRYQNFWSIGSISLTALMTWLFFRKSGFNYIEHLAINTFIFLHTYWLFMIAILLNVPDTIWTIIYMLSYFIMMIVVLKKLTGKRWISAIMRTLTTLIITFTLFGGAMAAMVVWYVAKDFNS
jgi:hypothetical protein